MTYRVLLHGRADGRGRGQLSPQAAEVVRGAGAGCRQCGGGGDARIDALRGVHDTLARAGLDGGPAAMGLGRRELLGISR